LVVQNDEKIETNSNNLDQCPKDTPPSVLKTPTKETLTKEKKEIYKEKFSDFVSMPPEQYQALVNTYGEKLVKQKIIDMDAHCANRRNGKPYRDPYRELVSWCNKDKDKPKTEKESAIESNTKYVESFVNNNKLFKYNNNPYYLSQHISLGKTTVELKHPTKGSFETIDLVDERFIDRFQHWFRKNEIVIHIIPPGSK
jgi:hypothetical protein